MARSGSRVIREALASTPLPARDVDGLRREAVRFCLKKGLGTVPIFYGTDKGFVEAGDYYIATDVREKLIIRRFKTSRMVDVPARAVKLIIRNEELMAIGYSTRLQVQQLEQLLELAYAKYTKLKGRFASLEVKQKGTSASEL